MLKACILTLFFITHAAMQTPTLADLAWMYGDWQTAPGGRAQIEEHWTQAAGGSMIGMGRTIAGDRWWSGEQGDVVLVSPDEVRQDLQDLTRCTRFIL